MLLHLAERAPMALVVHSGGKSLHGWFYCVGQPEDRLTLLHELRREPRCRSSDVDPLSIGADAGRYAGIMAGGRLSITSTPR